MYLYDDDWDEYDFPCSNPIDPITEVKRIVCHYKEIDKDKYWYCRRCGRAGYDDLSGVDRWGREFKIIDVDCKEKNK